MDPDSMEPGASSKTTTLNAVLPEGALSQGFSKPPAVQSAESAEPRGDAHSQGAGGLQPPGVAHVAPATPLGAYSAEGGSPVPNVVEIPKVQVDGLNPALLPRQPTGWAAVEKSLTDFDQQEIGAYKEDIDTLLVFAGLYSAVLTAFVLVSYPQLQEDTAGEALQVLRVIANQTAAYTILGGQLVNSTAVAPPPPSPFQPTPTAIKVNALWFASLVISLSTASLAILVKQWLRAYMAFASASSQAQLRIRHFRRSGLEDWKVFEIASILPLFLQISLLLFFVGLCYFTIDIHPTLGYTTLPLVGAWAFFLIAFTLSPIFSARCPYKTPALAAVTKLIRIHVYMPVAPTALITRIRIIANAASVCLVTGCNIVVMLFACLAGAVLRLIKWLVHVAQHLLTSLVSVINNICSLPQSVVAFVHTVMAAAQNSSILPWIVILTLLPIILPTAIVLKLWDIYTKSSPALQEIINSARKRWQAASDCHYTQPLEEAAVIREESTDLEILAFADALQADDEQLGTTTVAALQQLNPGWEAVTEFLVKVIGNRIPLTDGFSDGHALQDCKSLSTKARAALTDILDSHIAQAGSLPEEYLLLDSKREKAARQAICVFVSLYEFDFSIRIPNGLRSFHDKWLVESSEVLRRRREISAIALRLVCDSTCRSLYTDDASLEDSVDLLQTVTGSSKMSVEEVRRFWENIENTNHVADTAFRVLECTSIPDNIANPRILHGTLMSVLPLLEILYFVTARDLKDDLWDRYLSLARTPLLSGLDAKISQTYFVQWASRHPQFVLKYLRVGLVEPTLGSHESLEYVDSVLYSILRTIQVPQANDLTKGWRWSSTDYPLIVNLCYLALEFFQMLQSPELHQEHAPPGSSQSQWRAVFQHLAEPLYDVYGTTHNHRPYLVSLCTDAGIPELAGRCWSLVDCREFEVTPDSGNETELVQKFQEDNTAVSNSFCLALSLFHDGSGTGSWRALHLKSRTEEERLWIVRQAEKEIRAAKVEEHVELKTAETEQR